VLEELSSELRGKVKIVKLNIDENPSTTVKYGVRSIPTMILYKNGEAVDMKIGAGTPKAGLSKWLTSYAASNAA
jgi:thioredoxin 1